MSARSKGSPVKFGTQSLIKLKDGKPKPVRQFDASYSDVPSQASMATDTTDDSQLTDSGWNGHTEKGNSSLVPNTVPSHLLMVSILEQLCLMYTKDDNKSKRLFKVICEQLVKHHVVTPLTILDEMSSLRNQYRSFMDSVLKAGMVKVSASVPTHQLDMELDLAEPRVPRHENFLITSEAIRQMQTSRYRAEFTELKKIGSGGFGSVYMAKHNLDGRKYAIKKITFKHSQPEVWMKVLREVKALANVQHPNVVGYNAAWLEYATCPGRGRCRNAHTSSDNISTPVDVSLPSQVSVTDDSSVVFTEEFTESELHRNRIQVRETEIHEHRKCVVKELEEFSVKCRACEIMRGDGDKTDSFQSGFVLKIPEHECIQKYHQSETTETYLSSWETESRATGSVCMGESWENTELSTFRDRRLRAKRSLSCDNANPKRSQEKYDEDHCSDQPHPKFHVTLLIQMELCSLTLKDWLQNRNQHCCDQSEFLRYSDKNMKIFKQILKGVDFIHNSGLIHRDLKPRNIFLHEPELHVKIGDFGLAKDDLGKTDKDGIILTPSPDYNGEFKWESHTSGVGTSTYAAPEQLEGSFYSNKSDIYSLGVILHELFSHFKTEMEKFHSLNRLRQERKVDQDLEISWPIQAKFVKKMSSPEPHERPTAKVLLSSELFLTKDQIILDMQRKLDQKDTEIENLKKRLFERDKVISNMRKEYEKVESIKW